MQMKNFYKKLVLCVVVAAVGTTSLVGCGKKPTTQTAPGAEKAVPQTNLYVPKFDEDKNLMIFADCPISPSEINLKDYIAAGFTYYTMTEDTYPLTNADRKLGTADDGVINPLYTDVLERCDDLGLKVIIRNCWNDPYYFVNTSDETRHFEPPFDYVSYNIPIRNITTELTKYKAVAGYYLTDEPSWNRIEDHTPQVEWYNKYGGNTLFHLNLLQSYGSFMFEGHSFEEYVDHYCDVILKNVNGPKTLSTDYYPLEQIGDTKEPYIKDGFLSDYIILAEKVKEMNEQVTDENDKVRLNLYIQAYKSNDKRELSSVADVRFLVNSAMTFGAKSLNYYLYTGLFNGDGLVDKSNKKNPLYYWSQQANDEVHNLADAILNFDWVGTKVYTGQQLPDETNALAFEKIAEKTASSFEFISDITCRLDTVVSEMKDKDDNKAYIVLNYSEPSLGLTDMVNVYFDKQVNKAVIYINGERTVVNVKENAMQLKLGPGEAAFVYPVYDAE